VETVSIKYPIIDRAAQSWLRDHQWAGRAVLPAAKMLQDMAHAVGQCLPHINCGVMSAARFGKLFYVDDQDGSGAACFSIKPVGSDGAEVSLLSRRWLASAGMSRQIEHARVVFGRSNDPAQAHRLPADGHRWRHIRKVDIYSYRIAFGPAFHTICDPMSVCRQGCVVSVKPRRQIGAQHRQLGSLFVLDAAWQGACIWAQEYVAMTVLPVGFEQRRIIELTLPQERYDCHVAVISGDGPEPRFDIAVLDSLGRMRETVTGMRMRVVSAYPGRGAATS